MKTWKSSLATLVVLAGLQGSAQAQQGNAPDRGYPTYPGPGTNGDYYSITNGFGPYGLPGTYPRYQGNGLSGYGSGAILNEYFVPWPGPKSAQTSTTKPTMVKQTTPKASKSSSLKNRPISKQPTPAKPMGK